MATLTGQNIANTYKQLLQVGSDNSGLTSTVQTVQDGNGTNSALQLSQSAVNINGTFQLNGSTLTATASALNAVPNLTSYTGFIAVSSSSINGRTLTAGTGVSITNGNGTAGNPTIALDTTGVVSGSYGPATNFAVNAVGQIVSATAAASVSVSAVTANTFVGGTFEGTTGNFSSNVSVGGNLIVDGQFTPAALSVTGTINAATVSATDATFNNIVSAAYFVGDGSGLVNVPSAEGGTTKFVEAGTGIKITVDGAVSSSIIVSGTIAVSADQNFGTVSVSTGLVVTGSALFGIVSATNIDTDELLIAGVSAATVNEVAAVSALTSINLAAITSINAVLDSVSAATSVNSAAITSINVVVANVSALTSINAAAITSINSAITSINIVVANVSALTSVNTNAITSINSVVANVSALTSVNAAAITSINSVIDAFDFATSAELAAVSSALATSIATANTRITSVSDYAIALSATLATSIGNSNTNIAAVSVLTSINTAAITSINSIVANVSALTSVNSAAITSINAVIEGNVSADSGTFNTLTVITSASVGGTFNVGGNVGIGVSLPALPLDLVCNGNGQGVTIRGRSADSLSGLHFQTNNGTSNLASFSVDSNGNMVFGTGSQTAPTVPTERLRIDSSGNVGIGTSSPAKQLEITKSARATITSLTDGATITPDFDAAQNFAVTLGGNRTLANPSNIDPGQTGSIFVVQDGTGGRTLSFGAYWKFPGGTAPTLSTAVSAIDRIDYIVYTSTAIHAIATLDVK